MTYIEFIFHELGQQPEIYQYSDHTAMDLTPDAAVWLARREWHRWEDKGIIGLALQAGEHIELLCNFENPEESKFLTAWVDDYRRRLHVQQVPSSLLIDMNAPAPGYVKIPFIGNVE